MKRKKEEIFLSENYYKNSFLKDPWSSKSDVVKKEHLYYKESFLQDPWIKIETKEKKKL